MYLRIITIFFSIIIVNGCTEKSTNVNDGYINNIWGVWENSEGNPTSTINGKWIPTNLHIAATDEENIIRVRILDPIACTDSYPILENSSIEFSQYDLKISVLFKTNSTAKFAVENEGSTMSFSFSKTDKKPYWGMCD